MVLYFCFSLAIIVYYILSMLPLVRRNMLIPLKFDLLAYHFFTIYPITVIMCCVAYYYPSLLFINAFFFDTRFNNDNDISAFLVFILSSIVLFLQVNTICVVEAIFYSGTTIKLLI